uniref:N-acetylgalactosaminide beta-1,3-galactosyltransferase n=1 Tax=Parastrongyloides trichosuri TaxID=131310 RepID=A0A0N4ZR26_PARTI
MSFFSLLVIIDLNNNYYIDNKQVSINDSYNNDVFNGLSLTLKDNVKVFCVILTSKKNVKERAIHQNNTWVKRCNNYVFGSGAEDKELGIFKACHNDTYNLSFCKFKNTLTYAWKTHGDKFDWYIKADDDTYFIMENLRAFLMNKDPNKHGYYGFRMVAGTLYFSGGAGYVLSKATVKVLVEQLFEDPKYCRQVDAAFDDVEVGACLSKYEIKRGKSLDNHNKYLFSAVDPMRLFYKYPPYIVKSVDLLSDEIIPYDRNSMSDFPIAFHYISKEMMYALEYLLYEAEVIGRKSRIDRLNDPDNINSIKKITERYELIKLFSKHNY